jgi:hypothetical protein
MTAAGDAPLIGVINAGSSSLKFSFYEGERRLLAGQADGIGVHPVASATGRDGKVVAPPDLTAPPPATRLGADGHPLLFIKLFSDCAEQSLCSLRLFQDFLNACVCRSPFECRIARRGDQDNRGAQSTPTQLQDQFQTVQTRHVIVHD